VNPGGRTEWRPPVVTHEDETHGAGGEPLTTTTQVRSQFGNFPPFCPNRSRCVLGWDLTSFRDFAASIKLTHTAAETHDGFGPPRQRLSLFVPASASSVLFKI